MESFDIPKYRTHWYRAIVRRCIVLNFGVPNTKLVSIVVFVYRRCVHIELIYRSIHIPIGSSVQHVTVRWHMD